MNWKTVFIVLVWWVFSPAFSVAETAAQKADPHANMDQDCVDCHSDYLGLFDQAMTTRIREKSFAEKTFGRDDPLFFRQNCQGCHVQKCLDCHAQKGNDILLPQSEQCLDCHRGYYTGMEYRGMAPREDSLRYQRGKVFKGEAVLNMLPDVHSEAGMQCAECHSMQSLVAGKKASKSCTDCHTPDAEIIEHGIGAHLQNLECYACHSAWAAQEYGTFYLRMVESSNQKYFRLQPRGAEHYVKSAYLKKQDAPPLGINHKGKISPIRPQFIAYFTDIKYNQPVGEENRLMAAQWKAFFPHTVRRGTPMCDGCHSNARRFILEKEEDQIYRLQDSGMALISFWNHKGQTVVNGSFMPPERFAEMAAPKSVYKKAYLKKWKKLLEAVENSLKH